MLANGASYTAANTVSMAATASDSDSDSMIVDVEFLVDGAQVGQDAGSAYTFAWTATIGTHGV